jgi:hypothetical protein
MAHTLVVNESTCSGCGHPVARCTCVRDRLRAIAERVVANRHTAVLPLPGENEKPAATTLNERRVVTNRHGERQAVLYLPHERPALGEI